MQDEPPVNLVALRDGKQRAEALISSRYAEGLIDGEELERRLEQVQDASSIAALERLIVDLVEPGTTPSAALAVREPGTAALVTSAASEVDEHRQFTAVFSSFEQVGGWVPARHNRVVDVFADAKLDFRTASLGPGVTYLELRCVFSSMRLIVPPSLAVRVDASVVFGSVERDRSVIEEPRAPGDPQLVIGGVIVFASLEIRERLVGESRRDARRRHRALRKAAKKQQQRALEEGS